MAFTQFMFSKFCVNDCGTGLFELFRRSKVCGTLLAAALLHVNLGTGGLVGAAGANG
jgi:hypothetical protein